MSTRSETYIIVGVPLDVEEVLKKERETDGDFTEKLDFPWRGKEAAGKMGLLYDGMSGKYAIAGCCLAVSDGELQYLGAFALNDISLETAAAVHSWLQETGLMDIAKELKVRNWVVEHWH